MLIPLSDRASELGAEIGIIGGSGFYELLDDAVEVDVRRRSATRPRRSRSVSSPAGGSRSSRDTAANTSSRHTACRSGPTCGRWRRSASAASIGPCSCGSLQPDLHPGDFVVVDQLVDRTWGRPDTFHDVGAPEGTPGSEGHVHHQSFAEPYDADLREALVAAGRRTGVTVHDGGTMVVINGPRFSTRAESGGSGRWAGRSST
jgi:5'-methylthioadenosine phosphorylase